MWSSFIGQIWPLGLAIGWFLRTSSLGLKVGTNHGVAPFRTRIGLSCESELEQNRDTVFYFSY